jgi:phosphohistidine phosphatase
MKRIIIVRHGKAEWQKDSLGDFDRRLTGKGKKALESVGKYLKLKGYRVNEIISSPALHTQESSLSIAKPLDFNGRIYFMEELYLANSDNILNILGHINNRVDTLMLVGHNPAVTELAGRLLASSGKGGVLKIPKGGAVVIDIDMDSWSQISDSKAALELFVDPKQFRYYDPVAENTVTVQ